MPDVRNCRRCGKIYNFIGGNPICPDCKNKDEEDFKRVKEYLYKNPGATLSEVSTILELSVDKIKGFLKDGRLEIVGDEANMVLECEKCGKSIRSGRFCDGCSGGIANDLRAVAAGMNDSLSRTAEAQTKAIGMRYLNKDGKK